jgi:hypothetical protein
MTFGLLGEEQQAEYGHSATGLPSFSLIFFPMDLGEGVDEDGRPNVSN